MLIKIDKIGCNLGVKRIVLKAINDLYKKTNMRKMVIKYLILYFQKFKNFLNFKLNFQIQNEIKF